MNFIVNKIPTSISSSKPETKLTIKSNSTAQSTRENEIVELSNNNVNKQGQNVNNEDQIVELEDKGTIRKESELTDEEFLKMMEDKEKKREQNVEKDEKDEGQGEKRKIFGSIKRKQKTQTSSTGGYSRLGNYLMLGSGLSLLSMILMK